MKFETLYQELRNSIEMIRSLLAGISQEEAQVKPTPDAWSILEVICHLYDEEREDFRARLENILRGQNDELQVINPQGWVTERKYNEQNFDEMQRKFFAERVKSLEWLQDLTNADWNIAHTDQYGSVTSGEMLSAWIAHDNLHIRQLVELRRARIEKITQPYLIEYAGEW
ncbi:MAG: DinB family protein [Anaerolineaceae bacterium]|nr:MAG: DinB family protein [Anaerolineaceae bacterium]